MALGYLDDSKLTAIADAIRGKTGGSASMTVDAMPTEIASIGGGGSTTLKLGVLRPDAEIVQSWTYDKMLVADEGITIPAYSTSNQQLVAVSNLTPTVELDFSQYDYALAYRMLAKPIYPAATAYGSGRLALNAQSIVYEILEMPAGAISDNGVYTVSNSVSAVSKITDNNCVYWSSSKALSLATNVSYGIYANTINAPSLSGSRLTVKKQLIAMRGSSTYFASPYWPTITDIRYQYVIELWRSPKNNLNIDGYMLKSELMHILDCAQSPTGKLT